MKTAQENANIDRLNAQITMWEEEAKLYEDNSIKKEEVLKKIADAEVDIAKIKNDQLKRQLDIQRANEEKGRKRKGSKGQKRL